MSNVLKNFEEKYSGEIEKLKAEDPITKAPEDENDRMLRVDLYYDPIVDAYFSEMFYRLDGLTENLEEMKILSNNYYKGKVIGLNKLTMESAQRLNLISRSTIYELLRVWELSEGMLKDAPPSEDIANEFI